MAHEIIVKKLEQIQELLDQLKKLLAVPFESFARDTTAIRAAERDFQLIVELASDINTQLLLEKTKKTPDSYRQSFSELGKAGILDQKLTKQLIVSAKLRNILTHEYDFEEDYKKFYTSAKASIPVFQMYIKVIHQAVH